MHRAQHISPCKILLHPTASSSRSAVIALQHRTGLMVVIGPNGFATAIPAQQVVA